MRTKRTGGSNYARRPGFHVNGHPTWVRGRRCGLAELIKRGQETDYALRNLVGRFDKRHMLGDAVLRGTVYISSKFSQNALSSQLVVRNLGECRERKRRMSEEHEPLCNESKQAF